MVTISAASISDIKTIQDIVYTTWPITYGEILSKIQVDYMLNLFYSKEALMAQFDKKEQLFYLIKKDESILGFFAIENNYQNKDTTKIHKIYILPHTQGKGVGRLTIEHVEKLALANNSKSLLLNVNRSNSALDFYKKIGFEVINEIDIEIGNGYLMEDYIMEKTI